MNVKSNSISECGLELYEMVESKSAVIATSLMPRRIAAQQAAIESWHKLGFRVVSVNVQSEIDDLRHLFQGVELVEAKEAADNSPLVKISSILAAVAGYDATLYGIVNSDIILSADESFIPYLIDKTRDNALAYGSRIDVDEIDSKKGIPYSVGYDYFFFGKEVLDLDFDDGFYLGKTWWDFWLPISAALNGVKLRQFIVPVGYHLIHDQAWNNRELEIGKKKFISAVNRKLNSTRIATCISDRIRFVVATQGMEGFVGQIPSILMLNSELIVHGSQYIHLENISPLVDTLRVYQVRYETFFKSRSWRITAPLRYLAVRFRALLGK